MSSGLISGSELGFHHRYTTPNPFCRTSNVERFGCVFFNTQKPKLSFSIKNRSGSFRTKAAINDGFASSFQLNFYELLGISENGSSSDIKKAYKKLAKKYHPDVSPSERVEEHTQKFILVHEAYETLSDPYRRALYDQNLSGGLDLAFSSLKGCKFYEGLGETIFWRRQWEAQLAELKRRSMNYDSKQNMSWGAQMRRNREKSSANL